MEKELEGKFDWLVNHHDEIKNFKLENAHIILKNYHSRYCKNPEIILSHIEKNNENIKEIIKSIMNIKDTQIEINDEEVVPKLNQIIMDKPLYKNNYFWNNKSKMSRETLELVARARTSPNDVDFRIINRLILEDICKTIRRRRKFKLTVCV